LLHASAHLRCLQQVCHQLRVTVCVLLQLLLLRLNLCLQLLQLTHQLLAVTLQQQERQQHAVSMAAYARDVSQSFAMY
jgi:hypothetical protein